MGHRSSSAKREDLRKRGEVFVNKKRNAFSTNANVRICSRKSRLKHHLTSFMRHVNTSSPFLLTETDVLHVLRFKRKQSEDPEDWWKHFLLYHSAFSVSSINHQYIFRKK